MHLLSYFFVFNLLLLLCALINAATLIPCNKYKLKNGRVRMKATSKLARFVCLRGYMLIGVKYSACLNGYFEEVPPVCVNNRPYCKKINNLNNGLIIPEANNVVVHFFCKPEFQLVGSNVTICDSKEWIYQLPYCKPNNTTEPETSCDFEREDICGWSHDLNHDFDWKRTNSETPTLETGPKFDHTKGEQKNGHYMYIESTSRLENDTARLISPIFSKITQICVRFYYHMYGKDMGTLNVYIKREKESFRKLRPLFSVTGNQGDFWNLGQFSLENEARGPFQVIFEGLRGRSYISDIAIDDVSITDEMCPEETPQTTPSSTEITEQTEIPNFDSCFNRCGQNDTSSCSCEENCFELGLCCADFIQYCFLGTSVDYEDIISTTESTEIDETTTEIKLTYPTTILTNSATIIPKKIANTSPKILTKSPTTSATIATKIILKTSPKILIKSPTTSPTIIPKKVTKTSPKILTKPPTTPSTTSPTIIPKKMAKTSPKILTKPPTTPSTIITKKLTTTSTIFEEVSTTAASPKIETDFLLTTVLPNVEYLQQNKKNSNTESESNSLVIYLGLVCAVASLTIIVSIVTITLKRSKLNCSKFKNSRNNDSMSDVRFLASDEVLDFTWKRAESL